MANVSNSNTYYIDTASVSLAEPNIRVVSIILTGTAGNPVMTLGDDNSAGSYPLKLSLAGTNGQSIQFDFSLKPISFPNGIRVKTVSNCTATLILERFGA